MIFSATISKTFYCIVLFETDRATFIFSQAQRVNYQSIAFNFSLALLFGVLFWLVSNVN